LACVRFRNLCEQLRNHLFQGRIFDSHIVNLVIVQDARQSLRYIASIAAKRNLGHHNLLDRAESLEAVGGSPVGELKRDDFIIREVFDDSLERTIAIAATSSTRSSFGM
jgi:hypothetical protein